MANWIKKATSNKGGLHRSLGVPAGEKIPKSKIAAATKRPGKVGAQARLAQTLEGMHHGTPQGHDRAKPQGVLRGR